ncbi:MAG: DUF192 domain-containing protein, partial [Candidatus Polarisedimenticolia bacterium]
VTAAVTACGAVAGLAEGGGTGGDPRRAVVRFPSGFVIEAEIADTPERVARGYMFRRKVRKDEGMVFVFKEPGFHSFWMKNTLVPLDIVWMDEAFSVVHLEASVPPCRADPCPSYGPIRKVRYVLETRAGTARREGLKPGDVVQVAFPESGR